MTRALLILAVCTWASCDGERESRTAEPSLPSRSSSEPGAVATTSPPATGEANENERGRIAGEDPRCEDRIAALDAARDALIDPHRTCRFSVDCLLMTDSGCLPRCPSAFHVRAADEVADALAGVHNVHCPDLVENDCAPPPLECDGELEARCRSGRCVAVAPATAYDDAVVPAENDPARADPPPRPVAGDAEERAARLLQAIVRDEPWRAADFFFPREAFRRVKAMANPDRYWKRLDTRYAEDIHRLHERFADVDPDTVHFERLEIVQRGGYVRRGEEGNALPYWAARHNWLHYEKEGKPEKLEVRVLITWGDRWYITHLSEFR